MHASKWSLTSSPLPRAYIERNFHPPILFRDIRDLKNKQAYTAYGSLVDVPCHEGCVDLLVAGTSCVDYSNLNTQKKGLEDGGESGQTFLGMMAWIRKAKPTIVIIENVCGADWIGMADLFESAGYAAKHTRLDTKTYYIPHTRQRGYMFAVRSTKTNDPRPENWEKLLKTLERPASASLDAFMLPNDDPRVLRGRLRLTMESLDVGGGSRAGRTDWVSVESRDVTIST
jgi:site-specific DNA-cytosine methylase